MIVAGCDVGSTTGKVVLMEEDHLLASAIVPTRPLCDQTAYDAFEAALRDSGVKQEDIAVIVGTGYGRLNIPFAQRNVTEISCHGLGAFWADPEIRTIIDIGGQDCKVIRIDENGGVVEFVMNDKCAAGTGRFLEETARGLGVGVGDLGPLSLLAHKAIKLSSYCSVFAETEVTNLLADGVAIEEIASGINHAIALRLASLVKRVGAEEKVVVSGGVSKNAGVVKGIEERLGVPLTSITVDPQLLGAIGAALFARKTAERRDRLSERRSHRRWDN
ncbi:MAG: acyl-CoA dehydratase activase [Dehalococcoidia bacterium]|nr:acyl-CoA dehydratase activase [Dehalococcoidia bacterium]